MTTQPLFHLSSNTLNEIANFTASTKSSYRNAGAAQLRHQWQPLPWRDPKSQPLQLHKSTVPTIKTISQSSQPSNPTLSPIQPSNHPNIHIHTIHTHNNVNWQYDNAMLTYVAWESQTILVINDYNPMMNMIFGLQIKQPEPKAIHFIMQTNFVYKLYGNNIMMCVRRCSSNQLLIQTNDLWIWDI